SAVQREQIGRLRRGQAIVRLADRYQQAFLLSIPKSPASGLSVPDSTIQKMMIPRLIESGWNSGLSASSSAGTAETVAIPGAVDGLPSLVETVTVDHPLTVEEQQFLLSIVQQPFMS